MTQDEIFLNGKKFISSKRAAKETGYANDYIGQLCRGGKVESKMVGRNRFVEESSLLEYKTIADELANIKRVENGFKKQEKIIQSNSSFVKSDFLENFSLSKVGEKISSVDYLFYGRKVLVSSLVVGLALGGYHLGETPLVQSGTQKIISSINSSDEVAKEISLKIGGGVKKVFSFAENFGNKIFSTYDNFGEKIVAINYEIIDRQKISKAYDNYSATIEKISVDFAKKEIRYFSRLVETASGMEKAVGGIILATEEKIIDLNNFVIAKDFKFDQVDKIEEIFLSASDNLNKIILSVENNLKEVFKKITEEKKIEQKIKLVKEYSVTDYYNNDSNPISQLSYSAKVGLSNVKEDLSAGVNKIAFVLGGAKEIVGDTKVAVASFADISLEKIKGVDFNVPDLFVGKINYQDALADASVGAENLKDVNKKISIGFGQATKNTKQYLNKKAEDAAVGVYRFVSSFRKSVGFVFVKNNISKTSNVISQKEDEKKTNTIIEQTVINNPVKEIVTERVIEKTVEKTVSGLTKEDLQSSSNALRSEIYRVASNTPNNADTYRAIALTNRIDQLTSVTINDSTLNNPNIVGGRISGGNLAVGAGDFSGSVGVGGQLVVTGTATSTMAGDFAFDTNTLYIDSLNNRVGVGTTSPLVKFVVDATDGLIIPIGTTAQRPTGQTGTIRYNSSTNQFEGFGTGNWGSLGGLIDVDQDTYISAETTSGADNDQLAFYTAGIFRGIFDSNGKFGVGTTSPQTLLQVGSSTPNNIALGQKYKSLFVSGDLEVDGTTYLDGTTFFNGLVSLSNASTTQLAVTDYAWIGDEDADNFDIRSGIWNLTSTATTTVAMTNGINFDSNTFVIDPVSNNVGIGTNSPLAKLTVNGSVLFNGLTSLSNATTSQLTVSSQSWFNDLATFSNSTTTNATVTNLWPTNIYGFTLQGNILGNLKNISGLNNLGGLSYDFVSGTTTNATSTSFYANNFGLNSEYFSDLTGSGFLNQSGVLTLDRSGDWTGTFDGQEGAYYSDARNLTNFGNPFFTFFNATTTDALTEGSSNLYYTNSRVAGVIAGTTTDALAEGSNNLYWTNSRFDNRLSATTTLPNLTTLANLSTIGTITSGVWNGSSISDSYVSDNITASNYLSLSNWFATTTHPLISSLPSLSITESQISNLDHFTNNDWDLRMSATTTLPNLTILANLSTIGTITGGIWNAGAVTSSGAITGTNFVANSSSATSTFAGGLTVDTSDFVVDPVSGRVGIGTASPGAKLEVSGTGHFNTGNGISLGDVASTNRIITYSSGPLFRLFSSSSAYGSLGISGLSVGASYASTLAPTNGVIIAGNIGIGTTSPFAKLSVNGEGFFNDGVTASTFTATSTITGTNFVANSTVATSTFAGGLTVDTSDFVVDPVSGRVGIGTVVPMAKLQINANGESIRFNEQFYSINATTGSAGALSMNSLHYVDFYPGGSGAVIFRMDYDLTNSIFEQNRDSKPFLLRQKPLTSDLPTSQFKIYGQNAYVSASTNLNGGSVYVYGGSSAVGGTVGNVILAHNEITSVGNVGIGTTSPFTKLSVAGNGYFDGTLTASSITATSSISSSGAITGTNFVANSTTATSTFAGGLAIETNGLVYDYSTNNVGIGTATPTKTLSVVGSIEVSADNANLVSFKKAAGQEQFGIDTVSSIVKFNQNGGTTQIANSGDLGGRVNISTLSNSGLSALVLTGVTNPTANIFEVNSVGDLSGDRFVINKDGNVGIGTTSPFAKLSVNGAGFFSDGVTASTFTATSTITGTNFVANSATATSTFAGGLTVDTSDFVVDPVSGRVGIGTVSPTQALHVVGNIYATGYVNSNTGPYYLSGAQVLENNSALLRIAQNSYWQGIQFLTNATERMRIDSFGNIGIGTTSPFTKLSVNGAGFFNDGVTASTFTATSTITGTNFVANSTTATSTFAGGLTVDTSDFVVDPVSGRVGIGTVSPTAKIDIRDVGTVAADAYILGIHGDDSSPYLAGFFNDTYSATVPVLSYFGSNDGSFRMGTNGAKNLSFYTNGYSNYRMTIDGTGNVGIGTTSPFTKLSVNGAGFFNDGVTASTFTATSTITGTNFVANSTTATSTFAGGLTVDTSDFVVDPVSGRVGIGTAAPLYTLDVNGNIRIPNNRSIYANNVAGTAKIVFLAGGDDTTIYRGISDRVRFQDSNANDFFQAYWTGTYGGIYGGQSASGNFYINSTTHTTKGNVLIANEGGNVGIGTTSPYAKLSVVGQTVSEYFTATSTTATSTFAGGIKLPTAGRGLEFPDGTIQLTAASGGSNYLSLSNWFATTTAPHLTTLSNLTTVGTITSGIWNAGTVTSSGAIAGTNFVANSSSATSTFAGGLAIETNGLVYDYSTNNVGIGTTAPGARLDVAGDSSNPAINFTSGASGATGILNGSTTGGASQDVTALNFLAPSLGVNRVIGMNFGTAASTNNRGYFGFTQAGAGSTSNRLEMGFFGNGALLNVLASGNIGIGTTSPFTKLSVNGAGFFNDGVTASTLTATSTITGTNFVANSSSATSTFAGGLAIETSGLVYDYSTNNVGVGTATPSAGLDVNKTIRTVGMNIPTSGSGMEMYATAGVSYINSYDRTGSAFLPLYMYGSTLALMNGNVGVGVTAPQNKLDVEGAVAIGATYSGTSAAPANGLIVEGNVGIGKTDPTAKMQIAGGFNIVNPTYAGSWSGWLFEQDDSSDLNISYAATDPYAFHIEYGGGLVGIGTNAPESKLHVVTSGSAGAEMTALILGNNDWTSGMTTDLKWQADSDGGTKRDSGAIKVTQLDLDSSSMRFFVDEQGLLEKMTILNTGNIGMGDISPDSNLDILSSSAANTLLKITNTNAGDYDPVIGFELAEGTHLFTMGVDDSDSDKFKISYGNALGTNDAFVVDTSNNIGIGTASPGNKFTITRGVGASDSLPALGANGGSLGVFAGNQTYGLIAGALSSGNVFMQAQRVDATATAYNILMQPNGGNVGIGATTVGAKLHLSGGDPNGTYTNATVALGYSTDGSYSHFIHTRHVGGGSAGNAIDFYTGDGTASGVFPTNAVHNMSLVGGDVGIGDSTPDSKLDILSSAAANTLLKITNTNAGDYDPVIGFELAEGTHIFTMGVDDSDSDKFKISNGNTAGSNDRFILDTSGNLGVGGSGTEFTVSSGGAVVGATFNGLHMGFGGGSNNTNTRLGVNAFSSNTTGTYSTAIGQGALQNNTTGGSNTAIGTQALQNNINGSANAAMGLNALWANRTGTNNTALGHYSDWYGLTAASNTSVGAYSLYNIKPREGIISAFADNGSGKVRVTSASHGMTGTFTVTISGGTPYDNSVSATVIDANNFDLTSVTYTTATPLGYWNVYEEGSYNTAFGVNALQSVTTGSKNIGIGYNTIGVTTGSNNILIGYNISAQSATDSNQMSIGNLIFATGGFGTGTSVGSGKIGIGTTTPVSTLSVQGSLCVRDTGSCGTTAGTIYATTASITDIDLAENYPTKDQTLLAGEIVSLDLNNKENIKRAEYGENILGVISTKPGLLLGQEVQEGRPVALKGRVPVKVNLEGGNIAIGDRVALSSVAGVGKKANGFVRTIGIALENFDSNSSGDSIMIFVENEKTFSGNEFVMDENGNVGIGTTSPAYKLHVVGDIAATSFVNISTKTAKKDIGYLDENDSLNILTKIKGMSVARYRYNIENEKDPLRLGLIAEEAPTEILSVSGKGIDIYKLSTFILAGVKAQQKQIEGLEVRLSDLERKVDEGGFSFDSVLEKFETMGVKLTAGVAYMKDIVVEKLTIGSAEKPSGITLYDKVTGEPYCLEIANGAMTNTPGECSVVDEKNTPVPTIEIQGNNPAKINIGANYVDMGVIAKDSKGNDLTVGFLVNGATTTEISLDTSTSSVYTIQYFAVDGKGLRAEAERKVIVGEGEEEQSQDVTEISVPEESVEKNTNDSSVSSSSEI